MLDLFFRLFRLSDLLLIFQVQQALANANGLGQGGRRLAPVSFDNKADVRPSQRLECGLVAV